MSHFHSIYRGDCGELEMSSFSLKWVAIQPPLWQLCCSFENWSEMQGARWPWLINDIRQWTLVGAREWNSARCDDSRTTNKYNCLISSVTWSVTYIAPKTPRTFHSSPVHLNATEKLTPCGDCVQERGNVTWELMDVRRPCKNLCNWLNGDSVVPLVIWFKSCS